MCAYRCHYSSMGHMGSVFSFILFQLKQICHHIEHNKTLLHMLRPG